MGPPPEREPWRDERLRGQSLLRGKHGQADQDSGEGTTRANVHQANLTSSILEMEVNAILQLEAIEGR